MTIGRQRPSPLRVCRGALLASALLTLAITALRLTGEMRRWNEWLFARDAGGGGAVLGIGWLIPICGVWFARVLAAAGHVPATKGGALRRCGLGLLGVAVVCVVAKLVLPVTIGTFVVVVAALPLCAICAFAAWPALAIVLLAYAVLARVPVLAITACAAAGDWGTHYERLAPGSPAMDDGSRVLVLCVAQLGIWIPLTLLGGLFAGAWALPRRAARDTTQGQCAARARGGS